MRTPDRADIVMALATSLLLADGRNERRALSLGER
jgi:hypothetical protein